MALEIIDTSDYQSFFGYYRFNAVATTTGPDALVQIKIDGIDVYPFARSSICVGQTRCEVTTPADGGYCLSPGDHIVVASGACTLSAPVATMSQTFTVSYAPLNPRITRFEKRGTDLYAVFVEFDSAFARTSFRFEYRIRKSLGGGAYGPLEPNPLGITNYEVRATPGDLVEVTVSACQGAPEITTDAIPDGPPPSFFFELPPGLPSERMLVRNHRTDHPYPSPYQIATAPALRPRFRFPGVVRVGGQGAERDVWLRVVDPPDTSAYISNPQPNDNKDTSPKGVLMTPGCTVPDCRATNGSPLKVRSAADGKVEVILEGTDRYAGDNYQIEASFEPLFRCASAGANGESICAKSAVVTAWKRVYVEAHKMFARGSLIRTDVAPGATKIEVVDVSGFPRPPFRVRLIHAPDAVGGTPAGFYQEEVEILHVEDPRGAFDRLFDRPSPGALHLRTPQNPTVGGQVSRAFEGPELALGANRVYLADGVGVVTGNSADYLFADPALLKPVFDEAFVEFVYLKDGGGREWQHPAYERVIPFIERIEGENERDWVSRKWMRNAGRFQQNRVAADNHQFVFFGNRSNQPGDRGLTTVSSGFNDLWLFAATMSNAKRNEALVHEMGHQWRVNQQWFLPPSPAATGGHCDTAHGSLLMKHGSSSLMCTMTGGNALWEDSQSADGQVGFHYVVINGQPESEYLRIRERPDPVPQSDNPIARSIR